MVSNQNMPSETCRFHGVIVPSLRGLFLSQLATRHKSLVTPWGQHPRPFTPYRTCAPCASLVSNQKPQTNKNTDRIHHPIPHPGHRRRDLPARARSAGATCALAGVCWGVTGAAKPRGNGRLARFPTDITGGTPVPPAQTQSQRSTGGWYNVRPAGSP
jgi:hypothetical protein